MPSSTETVPIAPVPDTPATVTLAPSSTETVPIAPVPDTPATVTLAPCSTETSPTAPVPATPVGVTDTSTATREAAASTNPNAFTVVVSKNPIAPTLGNAISRSLFQPKRCNISECWCCL